MLKRWLDSLRWPQVAIRGSNPNWYPALGHKGPVWKRIGGYKVVHATKLGLLPTWRKRYVIPMYEHHTRSMPMPCWALVPTQAAIRAFKEKDVFANYARQHGLEAYLPAHYTLDAPRFPAVLKRTNLNAGDGIVVVRTAEDLAARMAMPPWAGNGVVLQELIEGDGEEVAHLVSVSGRIEWSTAFTYPLTSPDEIRKVSKTSEMVRTPLSAEDLAIFERFLVPVAFDGPVAVNYKRRADGTMAIFEFNARFGGSMMRPQHTDDLEAALRVILANARWHERVQ